MLIFFHISSLLPLASHFQSACSIYTHIFHSCKVASYKYMYTCSTDIAAASRTVEAIHSNGDYMYISLYLIRNNSSFLRDIKLPSIHHIEFLMTRLSSASMLYVRDMLKLLSVCNNKLS